MKIQWKKLLLCIALPLGVGALSALLTRGSMANFEELVKPPLAPPGWLFPVVWTVLYVLMGVASYLVLVSGGEAGAVRRALTVYGIQLAVNFIWSPIFFNAEQYFLAFLVLILLWILIWVTMARFHPLSEPAAWLLVPYLLWVTFAGYLNCAIWLLN